MTWRTSDKYAVVRQYGLLSPTIHITSPSQYRKHSVKTDVIMSIAGDGVTDRHDDYCRRVASAAAGSW